MTDLVTITNPKSRVAEAYHSLRTNLEFASLDHPLESLVVTSPGAEEGKSTLVANLAVAMAEANRRVTLVDCDLRRPRLHEIFGLDNATGLTSSMVSEAAMKQPPLLDVGIEGLQVLCSGPLPPNPSALLSSRRMEEMIGTLRQQSDIVIFDTPPVVAVTDAAILATKVDGTLLAVQAGATRRELAQRAKEILDRVNVRLMGAVLIGVALDPTLDQYYTQS
jgi:non-specific protein-tyrosine kinase